MATLDERLTRKQLSRVYKPSRVIGRGALELCADGRGEELMTLPSGSRKSANWVCYTLKISHDWTWNDEEDLENDEPNEEG
jgi:hypothetical protein